MNDLISRQAAIKAIYDLPNCHNGYSDTYDKSQIIGVIEEIPSAEPKKGKWQLDEEPHDGDCRCSICYVAIDQMHERHHGLLNALTGGKWWRFYKFCPNCGADMRGEE